MGIEYSYSPFHTLSGISQQVSKPDGRSGVAICNAIGHTTLNDSLTRELPVLNSTKVKDKTLVESIDNSEEKKQAQNASGMGMAAVLHANNVEEDKLAEDTSSEEVRVVQSTGKNHAKEQTEDGSAKRMDRAFSTYDIYTKHTDDTSKPQETDEVQQIDNPEEKKQAPYVVWHTRCMMIVIEQPWDPGGSSLSVWLSHSSDGTDRCRGMFSGGQQAGRFLGGIGLGSSRISRGRGCQRPNIATVASTKLTPTQSLPWQPREQAHQTNSAWAGPCCVPPQGGGRLQISREGAVNRYPCRIRHGTAAPPPLPSPTLCSPFFLLPLPSPVME